jgi:hypothetical protein
MSSIEFPSEKLAKDFESGAKLQHDLANAESLQVDPKLQQSRVDPAQQLIEDIEHNVHKLATGSSDVEQP